jgi:RIO kinase 1
MYIARNLEMKTIDPLELMEELDEQAPPETFEKIKKSGSRLATGESAAGRHRQPRHLPVQKKTSAEAAAFIHAQDDSVHSFEFTYKAARFEEGWLLDALAFFYEQGWISDVLRKVKVGKEASVYLCRAGGHVQAPLVAAKVYRPRMLRNLKNDQLYREGRTVLDVDGKAVLDLGMLKAQRKRSVYGEQIRGQSWIVHEFAALQALAAAGGDVPIPYAIAPRSVLMGYLGDELLAAPTLNTVSLTPEETRPLFERILKNVDLLLADGWVHGDLSAYNILYWQGQIALIDFPQVVPARDNRNAYALFERDLTRLCGYFISQGLSLHPRRLAADLWTGRGYKLGPDVHPALLDGDDPRDRQFWKGG